jgi:translation initiation factor 2 subunit 3
MDIYSYQNIMNKQPVVIVATIGSVSNGKSTIIEDISGTKTQKYAEEKKKGCSIKNGYANAKIYKCSSCNEPECFQSTSSEIMEYNCKLCNTKCELQTHISFIDNPGHHEFIKTMMNGSSSIDYAMLIESAANYMASDTNISDFFPAKQTKEHVNIITKNKVPIRIVCINKFDLVDKKSIGEKIIKELESYVKKETKKKKTIIAVSATLKINIDYICKELCNLPIPERNIEDSFRMIINRSFNINKQNINIIDIKGGVIGGIITRGIIKIGDKIKIYPGYYTNDGYMPINATAVSINSSTVPLDIAIPGGLIGIQLDIDPALTSDDNLVGHVVEIQGNHSKSKVCKKIKIYKFNYENISEQLNINDKVSLNINSNNIFATVTDISNIDNDININFDLEIPVCIEHKDLVIVSLNKNNKYDGIIGSGKILNGIEFDLLN